MKTLKRRADHTALLQLWPPYDNAGQPVRAHLLRIPSGAAVHDPFEQRLVSPPVRADPGDVIEASFNQTCEDPAPSAAGSSKGRETDTKALA